MRYIFLSYIYTYIQVREKYLDSKYFLQLTSIVLQCRELTYEFDVNSLTFAVSDYKTYARHNQEFKNSIVRLEAPMYQGTSLSVLYNFKKNEFDWLYSYPQFNPSTHQ